MGYHNGDLLFPWFHLLRLVVLPILIPGGVPEHPFIPPDSGFESSKCPEAPPREDAPPHSVDPRRTNCDQHVQVFNEQMTVFTPA